MGKWVKYNKFFIYTFFHELTCRRIFTLDDSNDGHSRKAVPFGGFVDIAPHFGGESPENSSFVGVNERFQANRAKY